MKLLFQRDSIAGLMFTAIGIAFAIGSTSYRIGVPGAMGPGFMPFWLGLALAAFGLIVLAGGIRAGLVSGDGTVRWDELRALLLVVVSIVLFAFLFKRVGLVISAVILVVVSSFANTEFNWKVTFATAAVLATIGVVIFVWGLSMPLPIWPTFGR